MTDGLLNIYAETLDDLERSRIAMSNRIGALVRLGADEDLPAVQALRSAQEGLEGLEHQANLLLRRSLRTHSLGPWVRSTVGVGERQAARLLAVIGDPYWHPIYDRPRTVSELWAFCGLHVLRSGQDEVDTHIDAAGADPSALGHHLGHPSLAEGVFFQPDQMRLDAPRGPVGLERLVVSGHSGPGNHKNHAADAGYAPRLQRGVRANWSTVAKTRTYLIAVSCVRQAHSPYRAVYLARRERTAETHSEWTPIHSHNDGLRITGKRILRDIWRESRRLHQACSSEGGHGTTSQVS